MRILILEVKELFQVKIVVKRKLISLNIYYTKFYPRGYNLIELQHNCVVIVVQLHQFQPLSRYSNH